MPATSGPGGVVHAARRAQLDPANAQRIIAITYAGDQGLIALRACSGRAGCVNIHPATFPAERPCSPAKAAASGTKRSEPRAVYSYIKDLAFKCPH